MAGVAALREDGTDVAVELDGRTGRGDGTIRGHNDEDPIPHHFVLILSQDVILYGEAPDLEMARNLRATFSVRLTHRHHECHRTVSVAASRCPRRAPRPRPAIRSTIG